MPIFITGVAGFIGFHLCKRLLNEGKNIIGIDNLNEYYDKSLKLDRLKHLKEIKKGSFNFENVSIEDKDQLTKIFSIYNPGEVVHLAAQAGVRYSIINPDAYSYSNLVGFLNILENCRNNKIKHLVFASSSSVYGGNVNMPFNESQNVDHPISLYAATKKSNELLAHSYSHLYDIPSTGLRFFTVYGPWGRPDMALFLFTKAILDKKPIKIFNEGNMIRDFTYIDDIIESLIRVIRKPPQKDNTFFKNKVDPSKSWAPYKIFNIGNSNPVPLMDFIYEIELSLNLKAEKIYMPMQPGDVKQTFADTKKLEEWIDYKPNTTIKEGIKKFIYWYKDYYMK